MIPKIIHYCWLSDDPVPSDLQKYMRTWKEKLPDYEFMKWDFNRFDKQSSKWVAQAFDNKKYAFAADYIRLYALYNYGGIYLDMDVEVLKSYDVFLSLSSMLCFEANGTKIEAATMGSEKGSAWVKKCLDYYENREFVQHDGSFSMIPIPQIMRDILKEMPEVYKVDGLEEAMKHKGSLTIFPSDYFSPKSYVTGELHITDNTYSIHQFSGTWLPWYVGMEKGFCRFFHVKYRDVLNRMFFSKTYWK